MTTLLAAAWLAVLPRWLSSFGAGVRRCTSTGARLCLAADVALPYSSRRLCVPPGLSEGCVGSGSGSLNLSSPLNLRWSHAMECRVSVLDPTQDVDWSPW
jgi:hypothetical protein